MPHDGDMTSRIDFENDTPVPEEPAAEYLGLAPATLRRWRSQPPRGLVPPPFIKYGSARTAKIRYLPSELKKWRDAHINGRSDGQAA